MPKTKVKTKSYTGQVILDAKLGVSRKKGANLIIKVDVGSPYTIIKSSFLRMNNIDILRDIEGKATSAKTANASASIDLRCVKLKGNLYLGEIVFNNPIVYISDIAHNNLLGIDYLSCCKEFAIDFHYVDSSRVSKYCYFNFDREAVENLATSIRKSKMGNLLNVDEIFIDGEDTQNSSTVFTDDYTRLDVTEISELKSTSKEKAIVLKNKNNCKLYGIRRDSGVEILFFTNTYTLKVRDKVKISIDGRKKYKGTVVALGDLVSEKFDCFKEN